MRFTFPIIALLLLTSRLHANELAERIESLVDVHKGKVAVAVKDLKTGQFCQINAKEPMPTASLCKFPLMIAAYQAIDDGKLDPDDMITLRKDDKVPGSGILTTHFSDGAKISLRDAIHLMIVYSDNTATNLVVDKVGLKAAAEVMDKLGCPETRQHSKVYRRDTSIFPERSEKYGLGSTTAADMVKLLEKLSKKELVSEKASEAMLAHLYACEDATKFKRFLRGVKIAHKTGYVGDVRTSAGLIDGPNGPIAVCVLTADNKDKSMGDDNAGDVLCGRIAQIAYRHFSGDDENSRERTARRGAAEDGQLKLGAAGPLVEALQRTLNKRMDPSPRLDADGDFGPMTESAVIEFQKSKKLKADGVVDAKTWAALGPLVEETPAPDPEEVNAEQIEKSPAESLDGPPLVTAKTWAIGDGKTGELLWGSDEDKRVDIASTTKIMTAYLVCKYAEQHPEVLDENVKFSKRADEMIGSTAAIRAGEEIAVKELMYGLLLPSGNDASVALAEHFGNRLVGGDDAGPTDSNSGKSPKESYDAFIKAMNAAAKDLSMKNSHFENTHGLTDKHHKASAKDLLTLAHAAMQLPLFKKVVGTARHGCTVTGPGGYERNVAWDNTNNLLKIEGYDGVKTGTTSAAGACLVSRGTHDDHTLIVVVLGAASSDSRYVDTRNLFRWGWQQLEDK